MKVRYGDRLDFRSSECRGPVCSVVLIQTGLTSAYVLCPSKTWPWILDRVSTIELQRQSMEYGVWSTEGTLGTLRGLYPDWSCQPVDKQVNKQRVRVKTED